jgi:hypothetical protein
LEQNFQLYQIDSVTGLQEFWVLSRRDWSRLSSRPYGLAFLYKQILIAPADYNPRLVESFDTLLLQAAQQDLKAPGEVRELFDLLVAYEWARGQLKFLGLQVRQRVQLGYMTAYLFLLLLNDQEMLFSKVLQWAKILALSEYKGAFKDLSFIGQSILSVNEPSWQGFKAIAVKKIETKAKP